MSIEVKNVTYIYMPKTPFERVALADVSLTIPEGSFTAIAGHTGSGKSTLVQHLNGLLTPTSGAVLVDGVNIGDSNRVPADKSYTNEMINGMSVLLPKLAENTELLKTWLYQGIASPEAAGE